MALQWIEKKFAALHRGDKRLIKRAKIITRDLASMADSPPDSCQNASALEAAYRFANNPKVQPDAILDAHHAASIAVARQCDTVILAQDTTVIDLTKPNRQVEGAGPREDNDKYGFFLHPLYALDSQGIPLGLNQAKLD